MLRCPSFVALVSLACSAALGSDLHVAPSGADANAGTESAPFASLARARDAVRTMKQGAGLPEGGVTVWIHKGVYALGESFALSAQDSGTPDRPVVYRAVAGDEARLTGGRELPASAFKPVEDGAVLDRLDPAARGKVLAAGLKALGITAYGAFPDEFRVPPAIPELFFNDQRMRLARWPNADAESGGWTSFAKVIESGPAPWRNFESDKLGAFEYEGDRPSRWTRAPGVWLCGYWCFDWASDTIKVQTIDIEKRQITLAKQHGYGLGSGNPPPRRYYAVNLLEELDQPCEYYLDRDTGELYFWPPQPLGEGRTVLSTLTASAIALKDVSCVTLQGLTVEMCAGVGIEVNGGANVRIAACRVRNTGQDAIVVDGGANHRVGACDICDTGTAGLKIAGGDRKTLTPCGHVAVNNHIYRVSRRQRTHAFHVHLGGVGVTLAHNLLHDGPHQAIGLAGNDHVIEFNEIHHTGMETDDCGAFYMGRNPSERGSVIRYNFWRDIGSTLSHGSCAVYFDDGSGGQTVFGNVFYRAAGGSFGAMFVHGGHDNIVNNNLFVECKRAIRQVPWNDELWNKWLTEPLWQERLLKEVDITKPPYIDRYPDLKDYLAPGSRPRVNHAARNVAVKCGPFIEGNWEEKDNFITDTDPGFVDAAAMNFQLRDDSIVFQKVPGFEQIPFDKIGLYRDPLRPKLPQPTH